MFILAKAVKEAKDAVDHADQIINELLVVNYSLFRLYKTFSENILPNTTLMACSWT
jgi:hypothetical protein